MKKFFAAALFALVFIAPSIAKADELTDVLRKIDILNGQIAAIQAELDANSAFCYYFTQDLQIGSRSVDVIALHTALRLQGIYVKDQPSDAFTAGLQDAVVLFQEKYGILPRSGVLDPATRAKLNALYPCLPEAKITKASDLGELPHGTFVMTFPKDGEVWYENSPYAHYLNWAGTSGQFDSYAIYLFNHALPGYSQGGSILPVLAKDMKNTTEYYLGSGAITKDYIAKYIASARSSMPQLAQVDEALIRRNFYFVVLALKDTGTGKPTVVRASKEGNRFSILPADQSPIAIQAPTKNTVVDLGQPSYITWFDNAQKTVDARYLLDVTGHNKTDQNFLHIELTRAEANCGSVSQVNTCRYKWYPQTASDKTTLQITDVANKGAKAVSDSFTVRDSKLPSVSVISPDGGETFPQGQANVPVSVVTSNIPIGTTYTVKLYGKAYEAVLVTGTLKANGKQTIVVGLPTAVFGDSFTIGFSTTCTKSASCAATDQSDRTFTISKLGSVPAPVAGGLFPNP